MTSDQQAIDLLKTTLREVVKNVGDVAVPPTERMRAALALAALDNAVADDGTPVLMEHRIDILRKIINGQTD